MGAGGDKPTSARPAGEQRPHGERKDLKDLRNLPRSALRSYQKKHAQPHTPRSQAQAVQRLPYPSLAAFAPRRFWRWMTEYWRFRIGRRHPFQTYDDEGGDNGVYQLRGDGREILDRSRRRLGNRDRRGGSSRHTHRNLAAPLFDPSSATSTTSAIRRKWARIFLGWPIPATTLRRANGLQGQRARSR